MENTLTLEAIENEWKEILKFITIHNQEKGGTFFIVSTDLKVQNEHNETILNIQNSYL